MYDPELGRFMQTDPIGTYDSMNLYQYAFNSPTNYLDPSGLSAKGSGEPLLVKRKGFEDTKEGHWMPNPNRTDDEGIIDVTDADLQKIALDFYNKFLLPKLKEGGVHLGHLAKADTPFGGATGPMLNKEKIFRYNNRLYMGEELNYIGFGMTEAAMGWDTGTPTVTAIFNNCLIYNAAALLTWTPDMYTWVKYGEMKFGEYGFSEYHRILRENGNEFE